MNDYITLDGKYYKTPYTAWQYGFNKQSTARLTLAGTLDVSYGPDVTKEWVGSIRVDGNPASGFGDIDDLRASLAERNSITFVDCGVLDVFCKIITDHPG